MGSMLDGIPAGTRPVAVHVTYSAEVTAPRQALDEMGPAHHLTAGYRGYRRRAGEVVAARFAVTDAGSRAGSARRPGRTWTRTWAGTLTGTEWRLFAERYLIELDERWLPVRYEDTLGVLTADGSALDAVSVDNREGWDCPAWGQGYVRSSEFYLSFAFADSAPGRPRGPKPTDTTFVSHAHEETTREALGYARGVWDATGIPTAGSDKWISPPLAFARAYASARENGRWGPDLRTAYLHWQATGGGSVS